LFSQNYELSCIHFGHRHVRFCSFKSVIFLGEMEAKECKAVEPTIFLQSQAIVQSTSSSFTKWKTRTLFNKHLDMLNGPLFVSFHKRAYINNILELRTIHVKLFFPYFLFPHYPNTIMNTFTMSKTKIRPHHTTTIVQMYRILS
jgi:hypothetical protein